MPPPTSGVKFSINTYSVNTPVRAFLLICPSQRVTLRDDTFLIGEAEGFGLSLFHQLLFVIAVCLCVQVLDARPVTLTAIITLCVNSIKGKIEVSPR